MAVLSGLRRFDSCQRLCFFFKGVAMRRGSFSGIPGGQSQITYEHESADGSVLAVIEVEFSREDYHHATFNDPAEGGDVEIVGQTLVGYTLFDEEGEEIKTLADLTEADRVSIAKGIVNTDYDKITGKCGEKYIDPYDD
jgi:hypothetical protein